MKFRVERDALAEAVAWAARSLPARPTVPVLAGLLLETTAEGLVLSSFDYEVSGRVGVDADVQDEGRALVSGRLLADITRSLPAQPVQVTTDGSKVVLGPPADQIHLVLNGKPGTAMASFKGLSNADLAAVITYTKNAWSNKSGQAVQPGAALELDAGVLEDR